MGNRLDKMPKADAALFAALTQLKRCQLNIASAQMIRNVIKLNGGWPRRSQFGKDIEHAAFLIVHNTSHDLALLKTVRDQLEKLQKIGEVRNHHFPNMYDLVAYYTGHRQRFGWILRCVGGQYQPVPALEDPEHVDALRAKYHLKPLSVEIARRTKWRKCPQ